MDISIKPLGAAQEVGRSCIIVKINNKKIMLDCGAHMKYEDERKFPDFSTLLKKKSRINDNTTASSINTQNNIHENMFKNVIKNEGEDYSNVVDLLIISHFHLDHCGALPYFTELLGYNGPIICTQPTKAILPLTLEDFRKILCEYKGRTSILKPESIFDCMKKIKTIELNETMTFDKNIKVTCFYAGHVLGASIFHIDIDGYTVVYTGDYNTKIDRHLNGAYIPKLYPDVFITETTYGDKVRDTKRVREREFINRIHEVISKGGKVLIPIFALGRAQELCIILDTYWKRTKLNVPIYFVGSMARKANFYYKLFINWMNNTVKNLFNQNFNVFDFSYIKHGDKSFFEKDTPMVIFATPGMLHGGSSLQIFKKLAPYSNNCVIIPGFCSKGTVGNKLLSGEKKVIIDNEIVNVNCDVYYMSFSAHADEKGLIQLIKNAEPNNLVLVHGDKDIMKTFKDKCEEIFENKCKVVMPSINSNNIFTCNNRQINITQDLFYYLDCLFKLKITNKKGEYKVFGLKYDKINNTLGLKKSNLLPKNKVIFKNKIIFNYNDENIIAIFDKFLEKYFKKDSDNYIELLKKKELEYIIRKSDKKIEFNFMIKNMNLKEENKKYKKIINIIHIFENLVNISI